MTSEDDALNSLKWWTARLDGYAAALKKLDCAEGCGNCGAAYARAVAEGFMMTRVLPAFNLKTEEKKKDGN